MKKDKQHWAYVTRRTKPSMTRIAALHLVTYTTVVFHTRVADMASRRRLRSLASHRLEVPPVRLCTIDKRGFPVAGANMWNDLPIHVTSSQSLAVFRQRLQIFLFSRSYALYDLLFFFFSGIPCEPGNNWHYLRHVQHVGDDDDDDDDDDNNDGITPAATS